LQQTETAVLLATQDGVEIAVRVQMSCAIQLIQLTLPTVILYPLVDIVNNATMDILIFGMEAALR
jgi:Ca2+/H+ antiporter